MSRVRECDSPQCPRPDVADGPCCYVCGLGETASEEREMPEHFMRGEDGYARFMAWQAGERG